MWCCWVHWRPLKPSILNSVSRCLIPDGAQSVGGWSRAGCLRPVQGDVLPGRGHCSGPGHRWVSPALACCFSLCVKLRKMNLERIQQIAFHPRIEGFIPHRLNQSLWFARGFCWVGFDFLSMCLQALQHIPTFSPLLLPQCASCQAAREGLSYFQGPCGNSCLYENF